jgi:hypothetical protein
MHAATKVHVMLRRYVVFTWMHNNRGLVQHVTLWNNTKLAFAKLTIITMMRANMWFELCGGLL